MLLKASTKREKRLFLTSNPVESFNGKLLSVPIEGEKRIIEEVGQEVEVEEDRPKRVRFEDLENIEPTQASIEPTQVIVKPKRGRPTGSKNKPKVLVDSTQENTNVHTSARGRPKKVAKKALATD